MLMPHGVSPLGEKSWAVVVTYEPDGYVSDKDAEKINYSELLTQMQKSLASANEKRSNAAADILQALPRKLLSTALMKHGC
jgi:uncharacterized membrane-anchored protein